MRAVALMYHDIVEEGDPGSSGFRGADADAYKLTWRLFRTHLRALADAMPAPLVATDGALDSTPRGGFMLTFDDGGASAARVGAELAAMGWRAHFFITTAYMGSRGFLDKGQVRDLEAAGHVVGSHSHTHPVRMASLAPDRLLDEWTRSVDELAGVLAHPVSSASVAGGYYSRRVAEAAAQAGIRWLFTSEATARVVEVATCAVHGRYTIKPGTPARVALRLARGERLACARQWAWWNLKKALKAAGGNAYVRARRLLMGAGRAP